MISKRKRTRSSTLKDEPSESENITLKRTKQDEPPSPNSITEEKETTKLIWFSDKIVQKIWKSPLLVAKSSSDQEKGLVVMRFTANLEKLDERGNPYSDSAEMESDEESDESEEVQSAKSSDTYALFRTEILRRARKVTWTLRKISPDGKTVVVPQSSYLQTIALYENDMEEEDEQGNMKTVDRLVPSGFYSGLYRQADLNGTKFEFQLQSDTPFIIRTFHMDVFSMLSHG